MYNAQNYSILCEVRSEIMYEFSPYSTSDFDQFIELIDENDLKEYFEKDYKRVLVVEDCDTQFNIIEDLLSEIDHNIQIDREIDGHHGIYRFDLIHHNNAEKDYDLIISDVVLAKHTSGVNIMKHCQAISPRLEILLISAYPKERLKSFFKDYLSINFLQKPLDYSHFYKKVNPALT